VSVVIIVVVVMLLWGAGGAAVSKAVEISASKAAKPARHRKGKA